MRTSLSGCGYGKGSASVAFNRVNTAALPPIPKARIRTTSPDDTASFRMRRNPCATSLRKDAAHQATQLNMPEVVVRPVVVLQLFLVSAAISSLPACRGIDHQHEVSNEKSSTATDIVHCKPPQISIRIRLRYRKQLLQRARIARGTDIVHNVTLQLRFPGIVIEV